MVQGGGPYSNSAGATTGNRWSNMHELSDFLIAARHVEEASRKLPSQNSV
jgi:hypothetical protein